VWGNPENWATVAPKEGDTIVIPGMHDAVYRYRTDAEGNKIPINRQTFPALDGFNVTLKAKPIGIWPRHFGWIAPLWREFWDWCGKPVVAATVLGGLAWLVGCL